MDISLYKFFEPMLKIDYDFLKEDFYLEENLQKRSWFLDNFQGSRKKQIHDCWLKFV